MQSPPIKKFASEQMFVYHYEQLFVEQKGTKMAAVEMMSAVPGEETLGRPALRLVTATSEPRTYLSGPLVAQRRAARARMLQRRRRTLAALVIIAAVTLLAFPGLAFGTANNSGLSVDLQTGSQLSAGMVYVVQPGDTLASIAKQINPVTPSIAYRALKAQLHSSVVIVGEHVLIP